LTLARVPAALTLERAGELLAGLLPARGPVCAASRFAEGSVAGAYRIEFAGAGSAPGRAECIRRRLAVVQ
jgi:hypothetical protein